MHLKISPEKRIISYKLLRNILIALSFVWVAILIADSVLVGFISSQMSFLKLTLITALLLSLMYLLTRDFKLKETKAKDNSKLFISLLFILTVSITTLSILDFKIFPIIVIILTSLLILFYFYKELVEQETR